MLAAPGFMAARKPEVDQRIEVDIGDREDMAAPTTVAAVGAAKLLVLLVPERHAARTAVPGCDVNKGFVYKLHGLNSWGHWHTSEHADILINEKPRVRRGVFFRGEAPLRPG